MIHLFDLDKTLWDCQNKYEKEIWAKQLVPPFKFATHYSENIVIDDVLSRCELREGVKDYFKKISIPENKIGFLSVGAYHGLEMERQPSVKLLQKFNIYEYFTHTKVLQYKTFDKKEILELVKKESDGEEIVFYDDDKKNLDKAKSLGIKAVDSLNIKNWNLYVG
jgi:predicted phosphatase